jgi:hypothetical protein
MPEPEPARPAGVDARHPIGGHMSEVVLGISHRLRLPALELRHNPVAVLGFLGLITGVISIALMAAAAALTGQPFLFSSLGPTGFLLFYTPRAASARLVSETGWARGGGR